MFRYEQQLGFPSGVPLAESGTLLSLMLQIWQWGMLKVHKVFEVRMLRHMKDGKW